jgi:hypothetical protein
MGRGIAGQLADEGSHASDPQFDIDAVGPDINALDKQLDLWSRVRFGPKNGH